MPPDMAVWEAHSMRDIPVSLLSLAINNNNNNAIRSMFQSYQH